jgi:hypothetical protein
MKRMIFEKRVRVSPPATPEEALRGLAITEGQRVYLICHMCEFSTVASAIFDVGLRPVSWSPKERLHYFGVGKDALRNLSIALDATFRHDLFDAAKTKREEKQIGKFLELMDVMMPLADRITEKRIRERWAGADGRSLRKLRTSFETDWTRLHVKHAGFCVDPPDPSTLELLRRVLSFLSQTPMSVDAVRKRLVAEKAMENSWR